MRKFFKIDTIAAMLSGALTAFIITHMPKKMFTEVKWTDICIALLTFALVWVTAWQAKLTKTVADAAMKSANVAERSLNDLERPWLFIEKIKVRRFAPPNNPNKWYISFEGRNVGRSPALIKEFLIRIQDKDTLSSTPVYTNLNSLSCEKSVAANGAFSTNEVGPGAVGEKDGKPIFFVAFGRITYSEPNGKLHQTGFAMEVSPNIPVTSPYSNKAYEYYD